MQLISIEFIFFWFVIFIFYYLVPKFQWQTLLIASLCFYIFNTKCLPVIIIIFSILIWAIGRIKNKNRRCIALVIFITGSIMLLVFYKFYLGVYFTEIKIHTPVGLSFFVLAAIGYCLDVHWERIESENSIFKIILFLSFFPALLQGPINRYGKIHREIFKYHDFVWEKICKGLQRVLWGLFKKLIIAERLIKITTVIFLDLESYSLSVLIFGVICYAIEVYADFSGYMDIVIGIAQTFGINMQENFKHPYFATSVAEFWRRWHITLGAWFKDYVMYAFVMSPPIKKLGKYLKKKNKKLGKVLPTIIGTMIVWILTGLWHGNSAGYIIWGLYYGTVISSSLCLESFYEKKTVVHRKNGEGANYVLHIIRTWLFVLIANAFICADSWNGIKVIIKKLLNAEFGISLFVNQIKLLISKDIVWAFAGCTILFSVSLMEERYGNILILIERKPIVFRWIVWYSLIFIIFLFGAYGKGYDISSFLYQIY